MKRVKKTKPPVFTVKRCHECFIEVLLHETRCHACNAKLGKVTADGRARKPVDWVSYTVTLVLFMIFFVYIWWAFF